MSRALGLGEKGLSRLGQNIRMNSSYRIIAWVRVQIAAPNLVFPSPETFIQILALLAFHTNRSRKISRLPCALGDITIGTSNQQTKEMEAMF
jgi:hypothetical protein